MTSDYLQPDALERCSDGLFRRLVRPKTRPLEVTDLEGMRAVF